MAKIVLLIGTSEYEAGFGALPGASPLTEVAATGELDRTHDRPLSTFNFLINVALRSDRILELGGEDG